MSFLQHNFSRIIYISFFSIATIFSIKSYAHTTTQDTSMWPKAEKGYKQIIITLPKIRNEDSHKVEIIPEKSMLVDCNHTFINGEIETKPLQGYGYKYYILSKIYTPASTRMACMNQKETMKNIPITTQLSFLRYNSKLPIVIYVPKDINVSYKIWSAGPLTKTSK